MSHKKIKIPRAAIAAVLDAGRSEGREVAASIVGIAVVAWVLSVLAVVFAVLVCSGRLGSAWLSLPACSSIAFSVVCTGVAVDTVNSFRRE